LNQEDKFTSFHNNIMGCVHYRDAIDYIVKRWDNGHKKDLLGLLVDSLIREKK